MSENAEEGVPKSHGGSSDVNSVPDIDSHLSTSCLPEPLTHPDIQQLLLENQKLIQVINQNQNLGKIGDCYLYLEALQRNILYLGRFADLPGFVGEARSEWPPSIEHKWARDEFDRLRIAVHTYGPSNLPQIVHFVATKSQEEVTKMMPLFVPNYAPPPTSRDASTAPYAQPVYGQSNNPAAMQQNTHSDAYGANLGGQPALGARAPNSASISSSLSTAPSISQLTSIPGQHLSTESASGTSNHPHLSPSPRAHTASSSQHAPLAYAQQPSSDYLNEPLRGNANFSVSMTGAPPAAPRASSPALPRANNTATQGNAQTMPMTELTGAQAPNGVGMFGSFQAFSPPAAPSSSATSSASNSFVMGSETSGSNTRYEMAVSSHPQPAISISMYDAPDAATDASTVSSSSRRSSTNRSIHAGYVPAPGQAPVNMDKTTLFTPSNPPRPGSPRSPRTPKSPKTPKSPASPAPPSPKPDKPDV